MTMKRFLVHLPHLMLAAIIVMAAGMLVACQQEQLDETPTMVPAKESFQWTRAEDVETRKAFMRNFGVGYSYNAVRGEYCNWEDIRCQVINRERCDWAYNVSGASKLYYSIYETGYQCTAKYAYSHRDYITAFDVSTYGQVDMALYNGEKHKRQYVLEDGVEENFYFIIDEMVTLGRQSLDARSIMAIAKYSMEEVLTASFRDAVAHLSQMPDDDFASVDSFTNVWGTHVIVDASLGGRLHIDLQNQMFRYKDNMQEYQYTSQDIASFYQKREETRKAMEEYKMLTDAKLSVTAFGGDQSSLRGLLGEYRYDGTRDFSTEGISTWTQSLHFDLTDESASNVEMVSMEVVPIWDFIAVLDEDVAKRVKAYVQNDAKTMQAQLGERNFFSAQFPVKYPQATCMYHDENGEWTSFTRYDSDNEPMVVNVVSGGRYIATVCHEKFNNRWYWVAYPIFDGKVKLACGLGVREDDNTFWNVRWKNGLLFTDEVTYPSGLKPAGDTFYINGGVLAMEPDEGVDYVDCQILPYVELSGGVRPDGSYQGSVYNVRKMGTEFRCYAPHDLDIPLISWETKTEDGTQYWLRRPEYTYIYNPKELK
jgi:hypothetical protein